MEKLKITQLENNLLNKVEQAAFLGGATSPWLCGCMVTEEEGDFRNTVSLNGTAPLPPGGIGGGGTRPPGPIPHDPIEEF